MQLSYGCSGNHNFTSPDLGAFKTSAEAALLAVYGSVGFRKGKREAGASWVKCCGWGNRSGPWPGRTAGQSLGAGGCKGLGRTVPADTAQHEGTAG